MSRRPATRSSVPDGDGYNDGLNLASTPELDGYIAKSFAEWPARDDGVVQRVVEKVMEKLAETPKS